MPGVWGRRANRHKTIFTPCCLGIIEHPVRRSGCLASTNPDPHGYSLRPPRQPGRWGCRARSPLPGFFRWARYVRRSSEPLCRRARARRRPRRPGQEAQLQQHCRRRPPPLGPLRRARSRRLLSESVPPAESDQPPPAPPTLAATPLLHGDVASPIPISARTRSKCSQPGQGAEGGSQRGPAAGEERQEAPPPGADPPQELGRTERVGSPHGPHDSSHCRATSRRGSRAGRRQPLRNAAHCIGRCARPVAAAAAASAGQPCQRLG